MADKLNLIFFFHHHQPFEYSPALFEEACQKAYLPFLQVFERHPKFKLGLYYSASLYRFFESKHPEIMDLLEKLNSRRQVEFFTGAYYEPILTMLSQEDQLGQIKLLTDYLRKTFGAPCRGAWLPYKAWEQSLVTALVKSGVEYIMADDLQLKQSGARTPELGDYFVTEKDGDLLKVFPLMSGLSSQIPLKPLKEFAQHLYTLVQENRKVLVVSKLGEEFGFTAGSANWIYQEEYLEKLLTALEQSDLVRITTCGDYLEENTSHRRIYLKPYLDPKLEKEVGGSFQNTLIKHEEANWIEKRGQLLSRKLKTLEVNQLFRSNQVRETKLNEARQALYAAQANYLYWIGNKGGLALPSQRRYAYEHFIKVEKILDELQRGGKKYVDLSVTDFDLDDSQEALASSDILSLGFSPRMAQSFFNFEYKPKAVNLFNTLSDYDRTNAEALLFSPVLVPVRTSFRDFMLPLGTNLQIFGHSGQFEQNLWKERENTLLPAKKPTTVTIRSIANGQVGEVPFKITKIATIIAGQAQVEFELEFENLGSQEIEVSYATSLNFMPFLFRGNDLPEERIGFSDFKLVDDELKLGVTLEIGRKVDFFRQPVYSVVRSEHRSGKVIEGQELALGWKMKLAPRVPEKEKIRLMITS